MSDSLIQTPATPAPAPLTLVKQVLSRLEIFASNEQIEALERYSQMVLTHNPRANITGARDVAAFIAGPLFDALTLMPVMTTTGRLVDIGSGGGLPAVPLGILRPEIALTLVEPRQKRAAFLRQMVDAFQLNATVLATQDRELKELNFDGATAQAVFPPAKWIARARRLLRNGGATYTLTSIPVTTDMLPGRVVIEDQRTIYRDDVARYAARLRLTTAGPE